jgi:hypothetical protein
MARRSPIRFPQQQVSAVTLDGLHLAHVACSFDPRASVRLSRDGLQTEEARRQFSVAALNSNDTTGFALILTALKDLRR